MHSTTPVVIFYYPCCAGGKFLINSLSLSKHSVLHDVELSVWDVNQSVHDTTYYKQKLQYILDTVPQTQDNTQWLKYELVVESKWNLADSPYLEPILEKQQHSFSLIAHEIDRVFYLKKNFPNSYVIKLTNYVKWMACSQFKMTQVRDDLKNKIDYWSFIDRKELEGPKFYDFLVDVDQNYGDYDLMSNTIKNLYAILDFDDFDLDLWTQYYTKYRSAHKNIHFLDKDFDLACIIKSPN